MKVIKKIVAVLLSLALVFSFSAIAFATGTSSEGAIHGKDIVLNNVERIHTQKGDYIMITTNGKTTTVPTLTRTHLEKEIQQVLDHTIYDRNGQVVAKLTSTVTGVYSECDHIAMITNITGSLTGTEAGNMSYSTSISGDRGTIYVQFYGAKIASISYRMSTSGIIQYI